jgi:hypothetical protein
MSYVAGIEAIATSWKISHIGMDGPGLLAANPNTEPGPELVLSEK